MVTSSAKGFEKLSIFDSMSAHLEDAKNDSIKLGLQLEILLWIPLSFLKPNENRLYLVTVESKGNNPPVIMPAIWSVQQSEFQVGNGLKLGEKIVAWSRFPFPFLQLDRFDNRHYCN